MMCPSVLVCVLFLGVALCAPESIQDGEDRGVPETHGTQDLRTAPLEKRSPRYDFGLGKRAYSYVSEYKRLPVYNFGLGKRSRLYSFGLGKRSVDEDSASDEFISEVDQANVPELFDQYDDAAGRTVSAWGNSIAEEVGENGEDGEKRARMYEFGLGKRPQLYNFGLGKRARGYNFGLGKRLSKFNFGLGKRERDMHRFSFGLGKRSDVNGDGDNYNDV
ncbi:unnamed protein product, partial [Iphiclides podalirius]